MAQMAPALAEAAGSPSSNSDITSSTVQNPLRPSNIGEAIKNENSRLHINSASLNQNGICRSLANSNNKTTTSTAETVSCLMEKIHKLNKPSYTRQKSLESTVYGKPNSQNPCPASHVEKTNDSDKIRLLSSQKETLVSTPTRIPITTTKTCGQNSLQNLSTCDVSVEKTNEEMTQRHSVARPESSPQALLDKRVKEIGCNQTRLVARARKLERRLRTLQTRQLESHVCGQLSSFSVGRKKSQTNRFDHSLPDQHDPKSHPNFRQAASHIVKEESSREKRQQTKSLDRVEGSSQTSHLNRSSEDSQLLGQIETGLATECNASSNSAFKESESDVARSLVCQLEQVEEVADSDVTQCSSGGESCDEMDIDVSNTDLKGSSNHLSQFYSDRGSIASRWAWLRSQVIDIERRIRRCEETYKTVRFRKKPVQLEKQRTILPITSKSADDFLVDTVNILNNINKEPHSLNISMRTCTATQKPDVSISRTSNNLLTESAHKEKTNLIMNSGKSNLLLANDHINTCTAARTRAVQHWQKRKLFSLSQFQKPTSNILCCCSSPLTACVLCQRKSQSLPQIISKQDIRERVSLVDLSFHPVLSFETEIPLSLHFGALLKKGNFQSKICKLSPPKVTKVPTKRKYVRSASSPAAIKKGRKNSLDLSYKKQGVRALRNRKNSISLPNTPKSGRTSTPRLCKSEVTNKKRPAAVNAGIRLASQLQKRARSLSLPSTDSRPSSPVSSSASPTSLGHSFPGNSLSAKRKKPTSNAFDINNIVIPYSMASTTRVERLQYKEIMTPAWRELVIEPKEHNTTDVTDGNDEMEDLSNLTFALRHMRCEEQERKRFLGMAIKKKKRATRQSSEATTPEPVSPGSLLIDGALLAGQMSSGVPSPVSSNPPSVNSSLNVTSPTGFAGTLPVVNMLPQDSILAKLDRTGKSAKHGTRRSSSFEHNEREDSNDAWPIVTPWTLRSFPLLEKEQEDLKNTHSPPPPPRCFSSVPPSPSSSRTNSPILSPVDSPDSAGNANWTVKVLSPEIADNSESDSKPPRKGIVLKLAKR